MTCPHCETWILDGDHRCRRCGRRVRSAPQPATSTLSTQSFPASNDSTARDYQYDYSTQVQSEQNRFLRPNHKPAEADPNGQQTLFSNPNPSRLVSFDSIASPAEREAIRAREAEHSRPRPLKQSKMEVRHARPRKRTSKDQQLLDFFGSEEVLSLPQSHIICDAPVAPNSQRIQASITDALIMLAGMALILCGFIYVDGVESLDKRSMPFLIATLVTVPIFYKAMWAFMNRDSYGTTAAGLRIVDFDGNPPSQTRRYHRMLGSFVSVLAAGIGLIWALVDEDALTWHDHISSTFPTIQS